MGCQESIDVSNIEAVYNARKKKAGGGREGPLESRYFPNISSWLW